MLNVGSVLSSAKTAGSKYANLRGVRKVAKSKGAMRARAHMQRNTVKYGVGAAAATGFGMTYGRWQPGSNAYNKGRMRSMGMSSGATGQPPRNSMGGYA